MASYFLSCDCGNKLVVQPGQAGESVRCVCGAELEVPTMRTLHELPRADDPSDTAAPQWTSREGLIFLGLVVAVTSLAFTMYLVIHKPSIERPPSARAEDIRKIVDRWTLSESWAQWLIMEEGLPHEEMLAENVKLEQALRSWRRWVVGSIASIVFGLLIAGGAALSGRNKKNILSKID